SVCNLASMNRPQQQMVYISTPFCRFYPPCQDPETFLENYLFQNLRLSYSNWRQPVSLPPAYAVVLLNTHSFLFQHLIENTQWLINKRLIQLLAHFVVDGSWPLRASVGIVERI
ncbi:MAG: hypothetical protein MKZ95_05515, partial [Pirellulales bacterium]|nr:hypothetical protein [Pirellulales bacterium]